MRRFPLVPCRAPARPLSPLSPACALAPPAPLVPPRTEHTKSPPPIACLFLPVGAARQQLRPVRAREYDGEKGPRRIAGRCGALAPSLRAGPPPMRAPGAGRPCERAAGGQGQARYSARAGRSTASQLVSIRCCGPSGLVTSSSRLAALQRR